MSGYLHLHEAPRRGVGKMRGDDLGEYHNHGFFVVRAKECTSTVVPGRGTGGRTDALCGGRDVTGAEKVECATRVTDAACCSGGPDNIEEVVGVAVAKEVAAAMFLLWFLPTPLNAFVRPHQTGRMDCLEVFPQSHCTKLVLCDVGYNFGE
ncbi:hypothetical protein NDU88_004171 [Pleurodeles waltl]|uniref:Uncharacterized protein n=1 Tax=Pleurodeles waltl TaxID=8319 RepID=A0AAV7T721_PLEWA|nr:hypothetical protein NDU88_004171 [Pleurodeles waltl]